MTLWEAMSYGDRPYKVRIDWILTFAEIEISSQFASRFSFINTLLFAHQQNLAGQDILVMFESNKRLEMPDECPPEVYDIMWKCWAYM